MPNLVDVHEHYHVKCVYWN